MKTKLAILLIVLASITGCFTADSGEVVYKRIEEVRKDGSKSVHETYNVTQPEGSKTSTHFTYDPDGNMNLTFGEQYNFEKIKQAFKAFMPWHYAGILLVIMGIWLAYAKKIPNKWSAIMIVSGLGMGVFAHFIPSMGPVMTGLMGLAAIGGIAYYFWKIRQEDDL